MVHCLFIRLRGANATKYHRDASRPCPTPSKAAVHGLCTGSLAAAATSTSTRVVDLLAAAFEVVLVAFRTRLRFIKTRNDLERSPYIASPMRSTPIWSMVMKVEESQALKELEIFSAAKLRRFPSHQKPRLSY